MPDFFGKLKSGAEKAAFEADKMVRVNRAQGDLNQVKKQLEAGYARLGELFYQHYQAGELTSPDFTEACQKIDDLQQQVEAKDEELKRISAETYGAQSAQTPAPAVPVIETPVIPEPAAPETSYEPVAPATLGEVDAVPQKRLCPNCGHEVAEGVKFCMECGTRV